MPENEQGKGHTDPHKIQAIGAGFIPKNLDTSLVDEVVTVTDEPEIIREEGRQQRAPLSGETAMSSVNLVFQNLPVLPLKNNAGGGKNRSSESSC